MAARLLVIDQSLKSAQSVIKSLNNNRSLLHPLRATLKTVARYFYTLKSEEGGQNAKQNRRISRPCPAHGERLDSVLGKLDGLSDHRIPAVQVPLCRPADDLRPAARCHRLRRLKRECLHGELSAEERLALSELNCILSETPQWSSEEELCHDMENIGGRVRFCRFWNEHYSMVQLTEDRNGKYSTAYVLDTETTPDVRKVAALQAQKELADRMQAWGVSLLDTSVPEQMKYDFLAEAASHLMQVLNDPEHITG